MAKDKKTPKKTIVIVTHQIPFSDRRRFTPGIYEGRERDVVVCAFGYRPSMEDVLKEVERLQRGTSLPDIERVYVHMDRSTARDGGPPIAKELKDTDYNVSLVSCPREYPCSDEIRGFGNELTGFRHGYTNFKEEVAHKLDVPLIMSACGVPKTLGDITEEALK